MGITLREWSQQWLEVYVKPIAKPSGYEHYYDNLHKHILPKLGDMPLKKSDYCRGTALSQRGIPAWQSADWRRAERKKHQKYARCAGCLL